MNAAEQISLFETKIAEFELKGTKFNLKALIFSSFYFWYLGMSGYFVLFVFLPILFMLPLIIFYPPFIAFGIGFAISHVIAGWRADALYVRYMKRFIVDYKDVDCDAQAPYFAISLLRFVLFCILSGGFYILYWSYRNWKSYKQATKEPMSLFLCVWFYVLTMPGLVARMARTLRNLVHYRWYGIGFMISSIICHVTLRLSDKKMLFENEEVAYFVIFGTFLLETAFLIPVQAEVNRYTTEKLGQPLQKSFSFAEIAVVLLGLASFAVGFSSTPVLNDKQSEQVAAHAMVIYGHTKGYSEVCAEQGYVFKQYPEEFKTRFGAEMKELDRKLTPYGLSLELLEREYLDDELKKVIKDNIYDEIKSLREGIVMADLAEENGLEYDELQWQEEWSDFMSLAEVCEILDNNTSVAMDRLLSDYHFIVEGL